MPICLNRRMRYTLPSYLAGRVLWENQRHLHYLTLQNTCWHRQGPWQTAAAAVAAPLQQLALSMPESCTACASCTSAVIALLRLCKLQVSAELAAVSCNVHVKWLQA